MVNISRNIIFFFWLSTVSVYGSFQVFDFSLDCDGIKENGFCLCPFPYILEWTGSFQADSLFGLQLALISFPFLLPFFIEADVPLSSVQLLLSIFGLCGKREMLGFLRIMEGLWDLLDFYSSSWALCTKAFNGIPLNVIQLNQLLVYKSKGFGHP